MSQEILCLSPGGCLQGDLTVPGDKSISHRALLFSALAEGSSCLQGLATGADVASTRSCLEQLGVKITGSPAVTVVHGVGLHGLQPPSQPLNCGNSGTTMRLLMGILAGQHFDTTLTGDPSLSRRPMGRVAEPLQAMGARIEMHEGRFAPLTLHSASLQGLEYELPVASAQVKSALLLAGLYTPERVLLSGALASRDHTERMLPAYGVRLENTDASLCLEPGQTLKAVDWQIPGDFSSAAFWLTGAALLPGSDLMLENISLNPTRTGFARILERMGARLEIQLQQDQPEPLGALRIRYAPLRGVQVGPGEIPFVIDEIPLLMLLATQATGWTEVHGAAELRIKESDRLAVMEANLKALGVELETFADGFRIRGPQALVGAEVQAEHDHRIAMTLVLAALLAKGETRIQGAEAMDVSYPSFLADLKRLRRI